MGPAEVGSAGKARDFGGRRRSSGARSSFRLRKIARGGTCLDEGCGLLHLSYGADNQESEHRKRGKGRSDPKKNGPRKRQEREAQAFYGRGKAAARRSIAEAMRKGAAWRSRGCLGKGRPRGRAESEGRLAAAYCPSLTARTNRRVSTERGAKGEATRREKLRRSFAERQNQEKSRNIRRSTENARNIKGV